MLATAPTGEIEAEIDETAMTGETADATTAETGTDAMTAISTDVREDASFAKSAVTRRSTAPTEEGIDPTAETAATEEAAATGTDAEDTPTHVATAAEGATTEETEDPQGDLTDPELPPDPSRAARGTTTIEETPATDPEIDQEMSPAIETPRGLPIALLRGLRRGTREAEATA